MYRRPYIHGESRKQRTQLFFLVKEQNTQHYYPKFYLIFQKDLHPHQCMSPCRYACECGINYLQQDTLIWRIMKLPSSINFAVGIFESPFFFWVKLSHLIIYMVKNSAEFCYVRASVLVIVARSTIQCIGLNRHTHNTVPKLYKYSSGS